MINFERLSEIAANPGTYGAALKKSGKVIIGAPCSYIPEEIILAAGAHPFRLFGDSSLVSHADAYLQSYCCSLVRGILAEALTGKLSFLDGVVFPHTCDTIQRLSDIWRLNIPDTFHIDLLYPAHLSAAGVLAYTQDRLERFQSDLGKALSVTIEETALRRAITLTNSIRMMMRALYALRSEKPFLFESREMLVITKAAMVMERESLANFLAETLAAKRAAAKRPTITDGRRLLLAGGVCHHPDIYTIIEKAGGLVVQDDLCVGSRYFDGEINREKAPLTALAEHIVRRHHCPAKHFSLDSRAAHLLAVAKQNRAEGVVFLFLKFCDPHAFDYPYLKAALDDKGIPTLLLEIEGQLPPEGQLLTRFETFIEML